MNKYIKWLAVSSRGVRGAMCLNVFLGAVSVACSLTFIYFCKLLIDAATKGLPFRELLPWVVTVCVLQVARIAITALNSRYESITYARLNFNVRQRLFDNLLQSRWAGKEKMHSGDALNRLFSDVDTVTRVVSGDIPALFVTLIRLVAAVVFLALLDIRLAGILVGVTVILTGAGKFFFRRLRSLTKAIREKESQVQSHIQESLQNKPLLLSLEMEKSAGKDLEMLQGEEFGQIMRRSNFNIWSRAAVGLSFASGYLICFLWGVAGISAGTVTFGVMTAFLQLVAQIQNPLVSLTRQIPSLIYATTSIDRLSELESPELEESGASIVIPSPSGLRVEGLRFRYPDADDYVFSGFDFDFTPGSKTAVVGETGVGKSTLIRLMLSLLRPESGRLVIYGGGKEATCSPLTRTNFAFVPQGNSLLGGTIRDNLLLGNPGATEEQMWEALDTAVAGFVRELPEGLQTRCGERGAGLSEGQAQRIAIARALLRPGKIMLLDEFSSSLDPATERQLIKNLTSVSEGKTMIFITHRELVTEYCDKVLRLD
ncbi:MAG: ABC transporter ATP-binding protein [Bacteroidales bacterium]|nr:ABC transporter ATP-binding protein [Bacteroidales bacterium]